MSCLDHYLDHALNIDLGYVLNFGTNCITLPRRESNEQV